MPTPAKVPLTIHEAYVEKHRKRDKVSGEVEPDQVIDRLSGTLRETREAAEQMLHAHEAIMADGTATEAARSLRARQASLALALRVGQRMDAARASAIQTIAELKAAMQPAKPKDPMEFQAAAEIRTRFLQLNDKERAAVINDAIINKDERIISAILGEAHEFLTGLMIEERNSRLDQWQRARFPNQYDRLKRLSAALKALDAGDESFAGLVRNLTTDPLTQAAEEAAARAAEAVQKAQAAE